MFILIDPQMVKYDKYKNVLVRIPIFAPLKEVTDTPQH